MPGFLVPSLPFRATYADGTPLAGGQVYLYTAGTSTPATAYQDEALTVPLPNPVILDSRGEAVIYIAEEAGYKLVVKDADDDLIYSQDLVAVPTIELPPASPTDMPPGAILPAGFLAPPAGFLSCDGSTVSRTLYATLFAVIGTTFGPGDGVGTFTLPDLRGRFPLGKTDAGTGNALGSSGGALDHTHAMPVTADHTHAVTVDAVGDHTHTFGFGGQSSIAGTDIGVAKAEIVPLTTAGAHTHTASTAAGGGVSGAVTDSANPAFLALGWMIKT